MPGLPELLKARRPGWATTVAAPLRTRVSWPAASKLQVSLNGQQIAIDNLHFLRQHAPVVSAVFPASGPVVGGSPVTLSGSNLHSGDDYTCRFGDASVAAEFNRSSQHLTVGTVEQGVVLPGAVETAPPRTVTCLQSPPAADAAPGCRLCHGTELGHGGELLSHAPTEAPASPPKCDASEEVMEFELSDDDDDELH